MKTLEQLGISPAPWASVIVRKDIFIDNKQGQTIANVWCNSSSTTANTRLIAAAPELYEALAALLNCSEKEAPFTMESGMSIAMDMARKAIEKVGDASPAKVTLDGKSGHVEVFRADGKWYAREGYEKFGEDVSPYRDCEIELGQGDQDGTETARGNGK